MNSQTNALKIVPQKCPILSLTLEMICYMRIHYKHNLPAGLMFLKATWMDRFPNSDSCNRKYHVCTTEDHNIGKELNDQTLVQ